MKTGETNQIHFTKPVLPRYQSQPKTSSRKSNRLIFLNRCEKILNKILEKVNPANIFKGSYTTIKWDSFREMQGCLIHRSINKTSHINKMKNKNDLNRYEKISKLRNIFTVVIKPK